MLTPIDANDAPKPRSAVPKKSTKFSSILSVISDNSSVPCFILGRKIFINMDYKTVPSIFAPTIFI